MTAAHPRELLPGVFWLGTCNQHPHHGRVLHTYASMYLVAGDTASMVVDTGSPEGWPDLEQQLERALATGVPPVRHLVPTHLEQAHCGNIGRLAQRFPDARIYGDTRDFHLIFPELSDRLVPLATGGVLSLGSSTAVLLKAVIKDLVTTSWVYDTARRVLFPGDGFAYAHWHAADQCGHTAEETPELQLDEMSRFFAEAALYWTKFTDPDPIVAELTELLERYPVDAIAPGHGLPIMDPEVTMPKVLAGLRVT